MSVVHAKANRQQQRPGPVRRLFVVPEHGSRTNRESDWETVYRENVGWVYRLMYAKVGNAADAEDLTTEVFLAALRPLRTSASVAEVRAYLRATARTVLANHWRERLGRPITTIEDDPAADESTETLPNENAIERVRNVLDRLPAKYRRILELRFLQAMSVKEAAAEMGVSTANAKVLQHRALRMAAQLTVPEHGVE